MKGDEDNMKPAISVVDKKILIGKSKHMTLQEDATRELWQSFMPYRQAIPGRVDEKLYNMKVFDSSLDVRQLTLPRHSGSLLL